MLDNEIIELYFARNENAISATDKAYGKLLRSMAYNLLNSVEDSQEVTQDGYMQAWNHIPPTRPESLKTWLCKTVRNLSINLWKKNHRQKRFSGVEIMLDELSECIPSPISVEEELEGSELTRLISKWLMGLDTKDKDMFVCRYFYGDAVKDIAITLGTSSDKISCRLFALRKSLKNALEKEGVTI